MAELWRKPRRMSSPGLGTPGTPGAVGSPGHWWQERANLQVQVPGCRSSSMSPVRGGPSARGFSRKRGYSASPSPVDAQSPRWQMDPGSADSPEVSSVFGADSGQALGAQAQERPHASMLTPAMFSRLAVDLRDHGGQHQKRQLVGENQQV